MPSSHYKTTDFRGSGSPNHSADYSARCRSVGTQDFVTTLPAVTFPRLVSARIPLLTATCEESALTSMVWNGLCEMVAASLDRWQRF